MKKYLFIIALLFTCTQVFAQQKIGYVDSQVILTQLPEAIKAQGELDALTQKWRTQLDSMSQTLQQDYANYQKQSVNMPEDKKNAAQQTLLKQQQALEEFRQTKFGQQGEIYKKNEEIFNPIKDRIYKAIDEVAKKEGMHFVFDKSGDVLLLYADSSFDVTYQVLDALKRGKK